MGTGVMKEMIMMTEKIIMTEETVVSDGDNGAAERR